MALYLGLHIVHIDMAQNLDMRDDLKPFLLLLPFQLPLPLLLMDQLEK